MKVKALSRSSSSTTRQNIGDLRYHHRNLNPHNHPMQRTREYARAVTSAKLDRLFAKPFVGDFEHGHNDAITAMAASRRALLPLVSGSTDGEIRVWDVTSRKCVGQIQGGHSREITGLAFTLNGRRFYSCSDDGLVRLWSVYPNTSSNTTTTSSSLSASSLSTTITTTTRRVSNKKQKGGSVYVNDDTTDNTKCNPFGPIQTWRTSGGNAFKSIDQHWSDQHQFATASSEAVEIWSPEHSAPVQRYTDLWGSDDTVTTVRYNPSERSLLAHCSNDRGMGLHDIRTGTPLRKTILSMKSNCLEWNPMEPMNFIVGNEDYNVYQFDMRNLQSPLRIHKGHVGAVLDVSWSPTGREFATGSYDQSIRIFSYRGNTSREIYHTKRMQRVWAVHYTHDGSYVISGSDDTNLRLWKAHASQKIGQLTTREEQSLQYRQALIRKYQHTKEVSKIYKTRKVPKFIKKQTALEHVQKQSRETKLANRIKHSKPGSVKVVSERKKVVIKEID